jgi:glyoxylase-like metal-dependent hydrolase (beta-lactamase superfamily II)
MRNGTNDSIAKKIFQVAPGVWGMRDVFVNFYMIQNTEGEDWTLIDAGLKWSAGKIRRMANYLFGENTKPKAIVLTHAHFDHVGSLKKLTEEWDVPVYSHYMEIPYLTGKASYPPPDPTVGGGLMAYMACVYPKSPINIWSHVNVLPTDGSIPSLPEWRYLHTPGHAPGHISLFRESDRVLIAGDAFVTTKQESALAVAFQKKIISGPPKYFTYDWRASKNSVMDLAALQPKVAATGHGRPMRGVELRDALLDLSQHFDSIALPPRGRYLKDPAVPDANGFIYIPENNYNPNALAWKAAGVSALVALAFVLNGQRIKKKKKQIHGQLLDVEYNF